MDWLEKRFQAGLVTSRNPYNPHQIRKISIAPDALEGLVFWSKDPFPLLKRISLFQDYPYYLLFTLNPYSRQIEPGLRALSERIDTFHKLADLIGPERVIWRYDPILYAPGIDLDFHLVNFRILCKELEQATNRCIVSFLDVYPKIKNRMAVQQISAPPKEDCRLLLQEMEQTARRYRIELRICSEEDDIAGNYTPARCIDNELLSTVSGLPIPYRRDPGQRKDCSCHRSIDIGSYNTCLHGCLYCYASHNPGLCSRNYNLHDPETDTL